MTSRSTAASRKIGRKIRRGERPHELMARISLSPASRCMTRVAPKPAAKGNAYSIIGIMANITYLRMSAPPSRFRESGLMAVPNAITATRTVAVSRIVLRSSPAI